MALGLRSKRKGPLAAPDDVMLTRGSERLVVRGVTFGVGLLAAAGAILLPELVDHLEAIVGPDQLAQIIEQLDDGKSLLRRPVGGDGERDGEQRSG